MHDMTQAIVFVSGTTPVDQIGPRLQRFFAEFGGLHCAVWAWVAKVRSHESSRIAAPAPRPENAPRLMRLRVTMGYSPAGTSIIMRSSYREVDRG